MTKSLVRKCGDCSACCYVLKVQNVAPHTDGEDNRELKVFDKAEYTRCVHQKPRGTNCCRIYKERPQACSTFACGWLKGLGTQNDRPDKVGVVFTLEQTALGPTLLGLETQKNATKNERPIMQLALRAAQTRNLALIVGNEGSRRIVYAPPGKEVELQKLLAQLSEEEVTES